MEGPLSFLTDYSFQRKRSQHLVPDLKTHIKIWGELGARQDTLYKIYIPVQSLIRHTIS